MANLDYLAPRLKNAFGQLPHLPRALGLVWAAARPWTASWLVLLVVQGVLPVATVFLTRELVNSLVAALGGDGSWETVRPALVLVAAMAGVLLLIETLRSLTGWVRSAQSELVQDHLSGLIHDKSAELDLAFYELPEYYDHLHRARADSASRSLALVENLGSLLQNGITLAAMAVVLVPFGLWLPVALVGSTLPALWVALRFSIREHRLRLRTTEDTRRAYYNDWVLTSAEHAPEIRLFDLGSHFRDAYQALRARLRGERIDLARSRALGEMAAGAFGLLVTGAVLAWMAWRTLRGLLTLGDLALFYQAFNQGQRLMRSLLQQAGEVYYNILFLGDLFDFLALEPQVVDPESPATAPSRVERGIRFRDVTFSYPGIERRVLEGFDLELRAGEIAAIVGPNGAGKSTLVKLLCRLYDPERGAVEIDGVDLRSLALGDLRRAITVLFQQPVHYSATVGQNIAYGDLEAEADRQRIEAAAQAAGADAAIRRLPDGLETQLGKWFSGGTDLSVGEWQRLALARAFLRRSPIILLDEPTSAMDSWAEADWMERFRSLAAGRTALVITHRFTTARRADRIFVMRDGRIVERGSHDELLAAGGSYAESWRGQVVGGDAGPSSGAPARGT